MADYIEQKLASNKALKEKNLVNDLIRKGIKKDEQRPGTKFRINGFKSRLAEGVTTAEIETLLDEI
ncbi:MAG: hypothetical protein ABR530_05005 [Pyrinomonadaceae bacterium]